MAALRSHPRCAPPGLRAGWTTGRIVSALTGALLALCSLGCLGVGGTALWASTTQRHGGDIDLSTWSYRSTGYTVASARPTAICPFLALTGQATPLGRGLTAASTPTDRSMHGSGAAASQPRTSSGRSGGAAGFLPV